VTPPTGQALRNGQGPRPRVTFERRTLKESLGPPPPRGLLTRGARTPPRCTCQSHTVKWLGCSLGGRSAVRQAGMPADATGSPRGTSPGRVRPNQSGRGLICRRDAFRRTRPASLWHAGPWNAFHHLRRPRALFRKPTDPIWLMISCANGAVRESFSRDAILGAKISKSPTFGANRISLRGGYPALIEWTW